MTSYHGRPGGARAWAAGVPAGNCGIGRHLHLPGPSELQPDQSCPDADSRDHQRRRSGHMYSFSWRHGGPCAPRYRHDRRRSGRRSRPASVAGPGKPCRRAAQHDHASDCGGNCDGPPDQSPWRHMPARRPASPVAVPAAVRNSARIVSGHAEQAAVGDQLGQFRRSPLRGPPRQ